MKEIKAADCSENVFELIGKDTMLVTAEASGRVNMMTASWGAFGVIWGKPSATIYIRQSRFTKPMLDSSDHFSLCVLPSSFKKVMAYCGSVSGRDEDKVAKSGLTVAHDNAVPYFSESKLVVVCRKVFAQEMPESAFIDKSVFVQNYKTGDLHTMYIGEIEKILVQD